LQRIAAVRLVLVARSAAPAQRGASCSATIAAGPASGPAGNAPQWQAADAGGKLGPQQISLAHLPDWQCYRYRTYETVIPLRNLIWGVP
jgi:type IV pilus assembly protein PilW